MLVFSEKITNRLIFTLDFIFKDYLNIPYELTDEKNKFLNYHDAKISYDDKWVGEGFFIQAGRLLFETDVHPFEITVHEVNGTKVLFHTENQNANLPFDILSAVFFSVEPL